MKPAYDELAKSLKVNLGWNKSRIECFVFMVISLIKVCSINFKKLSLGFESKVKKESRYRRIQRFFSGFTIDFTVAAKWLFSLFFSSTEKFYVLIDRTNWFWGRSPINVFMLSIAYEGISIPILWICLPKAGTSSGREQITLLKRFVRIFGKERIQGVLADREFANAVLFRWLNQQKIPFFIRIKEDSLVCVGQKKLFKAKKI